MLSSTAHILKKQSTSTSPQIDGSGIPGEQLSVVLPVVRIKPPSQLLPSVYPVNKIEAFRSGVRVGTGSSMIYNIVRGFKDFWGISPAGKTGKLADAANTAGNDARSLNKNITILHEQLDCVMSDPNLTPELKREAAQIAFYFLEESVGRLGPILDDLKIYVGLLKGNAAVGLWGVIVAGEKQTGKKSDKLIKKERQHDIERHLLLELSNDNLVLTSAKQQLREIGITDSDYFVWRKQNRARLETELNTIRGAGCITGIAIQGTIFSAINFGYAAATFNPVIFAIGAYTVVSATVRVVEVAVTTRLQNKIISASSVSSDQFADDAMEQEIQQYDATMAKVKTFSTTHDVIDALVNTGLTIASLSNHLPVATDDRRLAGVDLSIHTNRTFNQRNIRSNSRVASAPVESDVIDDHVSVSSRFG
jgi:hypothetical protein